MMPGLRAVHDAPNGVSTATLPSSSAKSTSSFSKQQKSQQQQLSMDSRSERHSGTAKATMNGKEKHAQQPDLDELPGSLQNATPATSAPASGYSTPTTARRKRRKQLSAMQLRALEKQKQQSNIILCQFWELRTIGSYFDIYRRKLTL